MQSRMLILISCSLSICTSLLLFVTINATLLRKACFANFHFPRSQLVPPNCNISHFYLNFPSISAWLTKSNNRNLSLKVKTVPVNFIKVKE